MVAPLLGYTMVVVTCRWLCVRADAELTSVGSKRIGHGSKLFLHSNPGSKVILWYILEALDQGYNK